MQSWYRRHLGIDVQEWGGAVFRWTDADEGLREEGCNVLDELDESEYGKFGWVIDPEGNKVELWQPPEGQ